MARAKKKQASGEPRAVPIAWDVPSNVPAVRVNNFVIQHTDDDFVISVFEIPTPIVFGNSEERAAKVLEMGAITALCRGRFVLGPGRMSELIELLTRNFEEWQKQIRVAVEEASK